MLTEENIANRKKGVGASEAATILGLNKSMSPYQLWRIKTGREDHQDLSHIPCVYWGQRLENLIAEEYAKKNNCKVRRVIETLFHKEFPFMLCHLDRKVVGQSKVLECKYAIFARDDWGMSGSDIVPLSYIVQVQYQLAITGYSEADLAVLISGSDYRQYHFKRDEQIINKLIEEVSAFWKCVESDTPPELRDRTDAELAYPFTNGNLKQADTDTLKVHEQFCEKRAAIKKLEEEKEQLADMLALTIKEAEGLRTDTEVLVSYKPNAKGTRVLRVMERRL